MASSGASAFFGRHYPNLTNIRARTVVSAVALGLRSDPFADAGPLLEDVRRRRAIGGSLYDPAPMAVPHGPD